MQIIFHSTFLNNSFNYIESQVIKNLTPIQKKVAIFAITCFSLITLSYFAFQYLQAKKELNVDDFSHLVNCWDDTLFNCWDDTDEEQVDISDNPMKTFRSSTSLQDEKDIKILVEKQDFDAAWESYVSSTNDHDSISLSLQNKWTFLPPVELIQNRLDQCATAADILDIMPPEFVRDCLIAYPVIQQRFLTNDLLENLFSPYEEYIIDICMHDKKFAKAFILSPHPKATLSTPERLKIFEAAYPLISKALNNNELDIEAMKCLSLFLLNYRFSISVDCYEKVKKIERMILKLKLTSTAGFDKRYDTLIKLVISKLNEQGIFDNSEKIIADDQAGSLQSTPLSTLSSSDEIADYVNQLCK